MSPVKPQRKHQTILVLAIVLVFGGLLWLRHMQTDASQAPPAAQTEVVPRSGEQDSGQTAPAVRVEVMSPQVGGIARMIEIPCSAHWYESVELFAKVSGYLSELKVDIGSQVKARELLATIDVPELVEDVVLAKAALQHQLATVKQYEAKKKSAVAEYNGALAASLKAEADVERWNAEHQFREKEFRRLQELSAANSVQQALVDEKLFQLQSVAAARRSAETAVLAAKEQAAAAAARVELAEADITVARMQAEIEEAKLKKAELYVSFSKILSPFDGVVTARRFHPGDFVRSAEKSADAPLMTIGRTDMIRIVMHIPDQEVPFANPGDPVKIQFATLPGRSFHGKLSRIALTEDPRTRTMRAEADLTNEDNLIVDQMYGEAEIQLQAAGQHLMLPSVCLVGDLKNETGTVFVVENGRVRLQTISIGHHDGIQFEVTSGLTPGNSVVVRPPAGLADGMPVVVGTDADNGI